MKAYLKQAYDFFSAEGDRVLLLTVVAAVVGMFVYLVFPHPQYTVKLEPVTLENPALATLAVDDQPARPVQKTLRVIDINRASETDLDELPGIGPAMAKRIHQYRVQIGYFQSVEELQDVKGIGPKKFEKMKPYLTVSRPVN